MPLRELLLQIDSDLDKLACRWLSQLPGSGPPAGADIESDRRHQPILDPGRSERLRSFYVARFALAFAARMDHHARTSLNAAQRHGATYQLLGDAIGASRQFVQRRYGVTISERKTVGRAIELAVADLPPILSLPSAQWSTTPLEHNVSTESDLSAAVVTLEGATVSSPAHVLLFHQGEYIGTALDEPCPGVTLLTSACTDRVVVIEFAELGIPHAGPPSAIYTARFWWKGTGVQWFGSLPPRGTSSTARCGLRQYLAKDAYVNSLFDCQPAYVAECIANDSQVLRIEVPTGAIEYVATTRYDPPDSLTIRTDEDTVAIASGGVELRTYPLDSNIRPATLRELSTDSGEAL